MRKLKEKVKAIINIDKNVSQSIYYIFVLIVFLIFLILIFSIRQKNRYDSLKITVTSQQRTLIQKLSKELILFKFDYVTKYEINNTIELIDSNLHSLTYGGRVYLDTYFMKSSNIPPTKEKAIKLQLEEIKIRWKVFKLNAKNFLSKDSEDSFNYILQNDLLLLEDIDVAVLSMQRELEKRDKIIGYSLYSTIIIIFAIFSYFLVAKLKQLNIASQRIEELESFLPICSNCKKIRKKDADPYDKSAWMTMEKYLEEKDNAQITHGMCPDCFEKLYSKYMPKK